MAGFEFHFEAVGVLRLRNETVLSGIEIGEAVSSHPVDGDNAIVGMQFELIASARVARSQRGTDPP